MNEKVSEDVSTYINIMEKNYTLLNPYNSFKALPNFLLKHSYNNSDQSSLIQSLVEGRFEFNASTMYWYINHKILTYKSFWQKKLF